MSDARTRILHLTQALSLGGANRAIFAAAKYSAALGAFTHQVATLIPGVPPEVRALAQESGVSILEDSSPSGIHKAIAECDILQISWWNTPHMAAFLHQGLAPSRVLSWLHVGGDAAPQVVTDSILRFSDFAAATSPRCYECEAISKLDSVTRNTKTGVIYGATDFARLNGFQAQPHPGFNIGYIGTLDFGKLHRSFIPMSAGVKIPGASFIVCGHGMIRELAEEATAIGAKDKFLFTGYVQDIRSILQIIDVYGLPLCEETYASSELNLQEAMYAGIPCVAFPHGGLKRLIIHNQTGLLVNTEREYQQALEHLYHSPEERMRLGANAKRYAQEVFGAENAAREFNKTYANLLEAPKRVHIWEDPYEHRLIERSAGLNLPLHSIRGSLLFVSSLGSHAPLFERSLHSQDLQTLLNGDKQIRECTTVMRDSGIRSYQGFFPSDPYLNFWAGVATMNERPDLAISDFEAALRSGFTHPRLWGYIAVTAKRLGLVELHSNASQTLLRLLPADAGELAKPYFDMIESGADLKLPRG